MVKILHAADFHMDSPFDSLPWEKAAERRNEQRQLVERIVELAEREKVQIILLAGDLLDSGMSYYETEETLIRAFSRASANVFIAPGNHDYYSSRSPYYSMKLPENVHIFTSPVFKSADLPELKCRVWGAGFNSASCPPLLTGFSVPASDYVNLMVLHGDVESPSDTYNPIKLQEIADSGLDYLALGHVHTYSGIKKEGGTCYAYPGCPEGRGFDETGEKGCIIGAVSKEGCDLKFVPLGGREYKILKVDVTGAEDIPEAVLKALPEGTERDIYRVILTGESAGVPDTARIKSAIEDKFYSVSVRDETQVTRNVWEEAYENTLKGLFLRRLKEKYDSSQDGEERKKIMLAVRYGLGALENGEEARL